MNDSRCSAQKPLNYPNFCVKANMCKKSIEHYPYTFCSIKTPNCPAFTTVGVWPKEELPKKQQEPPAPPPPPRTKEQHGPFLPSRNNTEYKQLYYFVKQNVSLDRMYRDV